MKFDPLNNNITIRCGICGYGHDGSCNSTLEITLGPVEKNAEGQPLRYTLLPTPLCHACRDQMIPAMRSAAEIIVNQITAIQFDMTQE